MLRETSDKEEVEMLKRRKYCIKNELPDMEEELKILLIPKDPNDDEKTLSLRFVLLLEEMRQLFCRRFNENVL